MPDPASLPDAWVVAPLSACVDVLDSQRKPINAKERATRVGSIPYYGATGQVGWIDDFLFDDELVLLGEDGAPFLDKSKPIAYIITGKSWVNNHAHVMRARPGTTSNRYIKYFLDSFDFSGLVQGSTLDKLTQRAMNGIPVLLAPRAVQDEMVGLIDGVSKIKSETSVQLAASARAVARLRQAILIAACSGKLTADWRAEHSEAEGVETALSERVTSRRRRASREMAVELALPDLPSTYLVATVGDAAKSIEYGTSRRCGPPEDGGIPILRMGNIQDGQLDLADLRYCPMTGDIERLLLRENDLLFNRTNSPELVGKSAVFHSTEVMSFASYLIQVRFDETVAIADFVNYWINSAWGRLWAQRAKTDGVSQSNINGSKLALMPLPLPPLEEQRVIVERASRMLDASDRILKTIHEAGRSIDRSSQAILAKAFSGRLAGAV